jgi:hypothetical protein
VVPVVASVLEMAEGQAAVPVEIDKAQSRFGSKIECIRKKGGQLLPDERFRKTAETRRQRVLRPDQARFQIREAGLYPNGVSFMQYQHWGRSKNP